MTLKTTVYGIYRKVGERTRRHGINVLLFSLAFLTIALSFALGYIVARDFSAPPIIIEQCSQK
jgi:hypothetical protein